MLPFFSLVVLIGWAPLVAPPDTVLAERLTALELEASRVRRESILLPIEAHLFTPEGRAAESIDPRFGTVFRAVCYAYIRENGMFVRRFAVHTPDQEALPEARNAARFLAALWVMANHRFGTLCSRLRAGPVDIWLTRSGQAGGEQLGSSIYIYDLASERSRIEWARELAHEYGHYLLPGTSGYSDPEDWSNGLLGERLFMRWLRQDLASGRLRPEGLPIVTTADVDDYCERQPEPLIGRIRRRGLDTAVLGKRDGAGMDEFSALMLFAEAVYGPRTLFDLLEYLPPPRPPGAKPTAFFAALTSLLTRAEWFSTRIVPGQSWRIYLPKGRYQVSAAGGIASISLDKGNAVRSQAGDWSVFVAESGWRSLTMRAGGQRDLHWVRK